MWIFPLRTSCRVLSSPVDWSHIDFIFVLLQTGNYLGGHDFAVTKVSAVPRAATCRLERIPLEYVSVRLPARSPGSCEQVRRVVRKKSQCKRRATSFSARALRR